LGAIVNPILTDATAMLDQAMANGSISKDTAAQAKARLPQWAAQLVHARGMIGSDIGRNYVEAPSQVSGL